jgi:hypothetical protein
MHFSLASVDVGVAGSGSPWHAAQAFSVRA